MDSPQDPTKGQDWILENEKPSQERKCRGKIWLRDYTDDEWEEICKSMHASNSYFNPK